MSHPCPRCGVPAPVVVSSDGALPPELVMADEAARLREALERIDDLMDPARFPLIPMYSSDQNPYSR